MKKLYIATILWALGGLFSAASAQGVEPADEPTGYYSDANGTKGYELKSALHAIIKKGHRQLTYDALWGAFESTDRRADGLVWDMYTNCDFTFDQHNSQNTAECVQINREHSFPKSWFSEGYPMYTDLFHLYPVDGYTNSRRNNFVYAEVAHDGSERYISSNGSTLGTSVTEGFTGTAFEPIDEYKGDLARTYFYMATRYEDKIASWNKCVDAKVCDGSSSQGLQDWLVALLLKWHRQDPVSEKELNRNDSVYKKQKNRNPFIDYPDLVEKIWGGDTTEFFVNYPEVAAVEPAVPAAAESFDFKLYPNPTTGYVKVVVPDGCDIEIVNQAGVQVRYRPGCSGEQRFRLSESGIYIVRVSFNGRSATKKLVIK